MSNPSLGPRGVVLGLALALPMPISGCTSGESAGPATPPTQSISTEDGVPDVTGLTTVAADRVLQDAGLLLEVDPIGGGDLVIVSQSPDPGDPEPADRAVHVQARCYPAPCPSSAEGKTIYDPCTCSAR